jgi:hypothetical protein
MLLIKENLWTSLQLLRTLANHPGRGASGALRDMEIDQDGRKEQQIKNSNKPQTSIFIKLVFG